LRKKHSVPSDSQERAFTVFLFVYNFDPIIGARHRGPFEDARGGDLVSRLFFLLRGGTSIRKKRHLVEANKAIYSETTPRRKISVESDKDEPKHTFVRTYVRTYV